MMGSTWYSTPTALLFCWCQVMPSELILLESVIDMCHLIECYRVLSICQESPLEVMSFRKEVWVVGNSNLTSWFSMFFHPVRVVRVGYDWMLWASLGRVHLEVWLCMKRLHYLQKLKVQKVSKFQKVHSQVPLAPGGLDLWAGIVGSAMCLVQFQSFRSDFWPSKYKQRARSLFALIFFLLSDLSKSPYFDIDCMCLLLLECEELGTKNRLSVWNAEEMG